MTQFLAVIVSYPTLLFTVPLGVVVLYWLFVFLGFIDSHLFHGGAHGVDGAFDGSLDAAGHVDAGHLAGGGEHLELGDGGLGHADGGFEHADGGADHAGGDHADAHHGHHHGGLGGFLHLLGLRSVPLTLSVSLLVLFAWFLCFVGVELAAPLLGTLAGRALVGTAVAASALALSLVATALCVRPLAPLFAVRRAVGSSGLVGRMCVVRTLRVDARFGQAEVSAGGAPIIVEVRCPRANPLKRGSPALIFEYHTEDDVYLVAPVDPGVTDPGEAVRRWRSPQA